MSGTSSSPRAEPRRGGRLRWLTRLRPRLVATLALVAALTGTAVAGASYLVVRQVRLSGATDQAIEQSRFNLVLAADRLPADPTTAEVESLLGALQRRGGFDTVVVSDGHSFQTSVSLGPAVIPDDLARVVAGGRIAAARRTVAGRPQVVVGGQLEGGSQLWFFHPLDDVFDNLRTLGRVLAGAAVVMVVLSGGVGALAARALLRPIVRARDAARQLEAGELATRLPEHGADEFAELSHSFNAMAGALERTVAELRDAESGHRRFVADVSHELRTPVTALSAAADVLEPRLDQLPADERRAARLLVDEAHRLRTLVEDLMEISRIDAGRAVMDVDVVDLQRIVEGVVSRHGSGEVRLELQPTAVLGDRRRLDRVIANLIDNAERHGRPPVHVRVAADGDRAVVEVTDQGPGIPDEHLPHLFDRFYKADAARSRSSSSGLGLAIAKENIELHGGTLTASNVPAGGACFTVTLSRATVAEPLPDSEAPVTSAVDAGPMTPTDRGPA